ncbi:hypothetical protein [Orenia marismortui]|uniref:MotA/TolQ/ExbB proton channel family protein n=1 Tax=Orenia marismortui TaxID=46469 RepID=A0A4R8H1Y1_9FIRM|nr:hypothetical protein [Orenia marismortui]TDX52323.1 hypothetical protein C7959_10731 [Orenia marismortui]
MNTELIIATSFILIVLTQAIILLKNLNYSDEREKKELINHFFRFISNSLIYVSALLIFIAHSNKAEALANIITLQDLQSFSLGKVAILITLFIDLFIILAVIFNLINNLNNKKAKENSASQLIDQEKAKKIT